MKQIIIIFFLTHISHALFAQTISIKCPNNNCSTWIEPGVPLTYDADTTMGAGNTFISPIQWSTIGASANNCVTNPSCISDAITWNNTPNTNNAHNVKAYLNYKDKDGNNKQVASAQLNVTVKYIGAITSMSITGDFTANPTNNSTLNIPCSGVQSLTISVPAPVTDPVVGVNYTWSLPPGLSGSSTSNTINISTTTGQTNGIISVVARRNDGTFTQSYAVNITRPVVGIPIITATTPANDYAICAGEAKLFIVSAANATSFSWDHVANGLLYNPNLPGTWAELTSKTTLRVTVDNGCNNPKVATKVVYAGAPPIEQALVNWQPQAVPNYIMNPGFLTMGTNETGPMSYNWQVLNGSANIYYAG